MRATLEAVAYQTYDLFEAMSKDGVVPEVLRVDGGMMENDWLVQFLADVLDMTIDRPVIMETTAAGAAYLAGLRLDIYPEPGKFSQAREFDVRFSPDMAEKHRRLLLDGWHEAVRRVLSRETR